MNQEERQAKICQRIVQRGECSVEELTDALGVSGMTIRRDLQVLADRGQVIRTHGGATLGERVSFDFAFLQRARENQEAKREIAKTAARLCENAKTIMLDGSTTTLAIARALRGRTGLTVITTSLPAAAELQFDQGIDVLLPGGYIQPYSPDLTGSLTEQNLEMLRADITFLGVDGIDSEGGVYTKPPDNTHMLLKMASSAREVYVAADGSKFNRHALRRFGYLADWAGLVTNSDADPDFLSQLRAAGVKVFL